MHTIPEEIEPLKARTRAARGGFFRGHNKREAQIELCEQASLVVGIGPRIFAQIPIGQSDASHELIPGLNPELLGLSITRARQASCLLTGRMEDADLKGLRTAARAISNLRTSRSSVMDDSAPSLVVRGLDTIYGEDELREAGLGQQQRGGWLRPRPYSENAADIYGDIQTSTLVLMPSLSEGFGLAGYEAIAAGVPVLMSEDSGLADLMKYAEKNSLIDAGFAEACIVASGGNEQVIQGKWADQIRALHADLDAAFNRAAAVRTRMRSHFTWSNAARELVAKLEILE
ncbi:MAG: glycosyltransferase [Brevundimonas sp.]|nr:glycosyltransferase [Brevundimonas sp.]MDK2745689.1 glycosyltransferase [Brevundimonas sp.]